MLLPGRTVSVVIPCYNYGRYLNQCVDSVLTQSGVTTEILIVDDASTDETARIGARLQASCDSVEFIQNPRNMGNIRTYNLGLKLVTGDYVVLLSADDLLAPGSLARSLDLLNTHPEVGFVYGRMKHFSSVVPDLGGSRARPRWNIWPGSRWITNCVESGQNPIMSPEAVMRTEVLAEAGYYSEDNTHGADFELWLRAAQIADVGWIGGVDQAFRRIHGANMSVTLNSGWLADLQVRRHAFENSLPPELAARAGVSLAIEALERAGDEICNDPDSDVKPLLRFAEERGERVLASWWPRFELRWLQSSHSSAVRTLGIGARKARRRIQLHLRWRRWNSKGL